MKLKEYSRILNLKYKHCVVLVKFGNFYRCFDNLGAIKKLLNNSINYKKNIVKIFFLFYNII